jgi:hypothetical protein
MMLALLVTAVAFGAFSIWITVRIINRRGRWAKWVLGVMLALPLLYVAGFGPACWLAKPRPTNRSGVARHFPDDDHAVFAPRIYWPIGWVVRNRNYRTFTRIVTWYAYLGHSSTEVVVPATSDGLLGTRL